MSSPREASPCDAVIVQAAFAQPDDSQPGNNQPDDNQPGNEHTGEDGPRHGRLCSASRLQVGPLRLPRLHQAEFVQQFNQLYRSLGMRLEILEDQPVDSA